MSGTNGTSLKLTLCGVLAAVSSIYQASSASRVEFWLTDPDSAARFEKQSQPPAFDAPSNSYPTIIVDPSRTFQTMDGFGYTLTGGSATHLLRMSAPARAALLRELFATDGTNIGVSYLRVSIGASDLNDHPFTYDDMPAGQTDPVLAHFDLGPDQTTVVPILQQVLQINPSLKLLGSPWTAPAWMKSNGDTRGGNLKPECYAVYAQYFVKYLQAMKAEGITLDAVTVQNEPLHAGNNPSMHMTAEEQTDFIKNHLGPAFARAGLRTKIICYDHNADRPDYPLTILNDAAARKYVDGSAFHLYAGRIEALSQVHEAHPDKNLYFTEQWIGAPGKLKGDLAWHVGQLIVGAPRNWCRTVLEWNLSSDPQLQPHTDRGGCSRCLGAVTLDGDRVTRNPAYYIIAHASKFVRPGSLRVESTALTALPNVAFRTPDGRRVLIVLNRNAALQPFNLQSQGKLLPASLPAGAVGTYIW